MPTGLRCVSGCRVLPEGDFWRPGSGPGDSLDPSYNSAMRTVIALLLMFASPALAQFEGAAATRRQKVWLEPLVEMTAKRMELHFPSFTARDLEGKVEKVLFNQAPRVVNKRWEQLIIDLLVEDLGLAKADENRVRYGPSKGWGADAPDWPRKLLDFPDTWPGTREEAYLVTRVTADQQLVLRRKPEVDRRMIAWRGPELSKDQARGLSELADYWSERLCREFGYDRTDRRFEELLESLFETADTERVVMGTLVKLRYLVRPAVREALDADDFGKIMDAEESVQELIIRNLEEAEWWPLLQEDHRAMVKDPKRHRSVIKDRKKAEKDAAKAAKKEAEDGGK